MNNRKSDFDHVGSEYERQLDRGISLSGQKRDYFIQWRVKLVKEWIGEVTVLKILDYGCAEGLASRYLLDAFPGASYVGFDPSTVLIEKARELHGSLEVQFVDSLSECELAAFDLIYANGVFHHIPIVHRNEELKQIHDYLSSTGVFAFWENNPWHLGTQIVMALIPFDRGVHKISPRAASKMLKDAGFALTEKKSAFHFPYFETMPKSLFKILLNNQLGAQYCILSRKK